MAFTIRQLQFFVAVAEQGTVSRAAQTLSISQSSVTEAIKDLESDLGVELFERHPRGLNITHKGHQFLRHATKILISVSDARRAFHAGQEATGGRLQLGVTSLVAGYVLSDLLARYRRAMLWNPPIEGTPVETLPAFLMTLQKADRPHGGPFNYLSPNSDLLGHIIETVTGARYADLLSDLLWKPMGARNHGSITVDAIGSPRTAGGISVTARDLARVGELLRNDGAVEGRQVVPAAWVADMRENGDRQAWQEGRNVDLPNGRYRSQWYQSGDADGAFAAIGIHGQWLWVDPSTQTVLVKLSSQPDPLGDEEGQDVFAFFRTICGMSF